MNKFHTLMDSPVGTIVIVREEDLVTRISLSHQKHLPDPATFGDHRSDGSPDVREQLTQYFAGERHDFDLPLPHRGTTFQLRVWRTLAKIPYGATWSYGQLAEAIGQPTAVRAVGLANGRNPHAIVVPCHRVIGANGSLTGYAGGLEMKRYLLGLEGSSVTNTVQRDGRLRVPA